ncbi:MAG: AAA-like domain-containing protein [Methylobacteriaceae bacterium]|nr:AAA-like domain-containing protein [Methylobacteriaceae bacterium]
MLDAVARLPEALKLALNQRYFVIHAPRQSGKTTLLNTLTGDVNFGGRFYALYCSLEALQGITEIAQSIPMVIGLLDTAVSLVPEIKSRYPGRLQAGEPGAEIRMALSNLCAALDKPLIVFFDEADCLSDQTLITFLRQLRDGYVNIIRAPFPWSISLIGMRDIRDFKAQIRPEEQTLGSASPFNIVTKALTLTNFTVEQVGELYQQHTEATGQVFEPGAVERAWYWCEGQPWLVNALARQIVEDDLALDYSKPVTAEHFDAAAETLMLRRDTHIDSLLERLKEPRVRKVIDPVLAGTSPTVSLLSDDTKFCLDLGLLKTDADGKLTPANPIYRDMIVRTLNYDTQMSLPASLQHRWMDGKTLDMNGLLREFQQFWRENSGIWMEKYDFLESAPHLIMQAFLQRVVNGGGRIIREYALDRGRVDVGVIYKDHTYPVELKLAGPKARKDGLEQLERYMDTCGASEGWLVIFDRDQTKPWEERIYWVTETLPDGSTVHIVGC